MSAIDALIKQHLDYTCKEANKDDCAFVKDVVQLRTRAAEADALWATVAAQAQTIDGLESQLRDVTDLIRRVWEMADNETSTVEIQTESNMWQIEADTRAWLAANAPTPTQGETESEA